MVTRRVTIIGASGTLGREVSRKLVAEGWQVVAATRKPDGAQSLAQAGAEVRRADLRDAESLREVCRGSNAVVAAAHALLGRGANDSGAVDFTGHRTLIDAARAERVDHFVYTSVRGAAPDHVPATPRRSSSLSSAIAHGMRRSRLAGRTTCRAPTWRRCTRASRGVP